MKDTDMTKWKVFEASYRACEGIYGRTPSDLDIQRAYKRYLKIVS